MMESLPIEMIREIAEYLTTQDLAASCSVSRGWRDIFSHDALWQPHCDPSLEEYLRTTPDTVEPVFVSPEGEDSTLSPVGHWRLAFMRENHLRNKWRKGVFVTEQLCQKDKFVEEYSTADKVYEITMCGFISHSCVFKVTDSGIEVWDVNNIPASLVVIMKSHLPTVGVLSLSKPVVTCVSIDVAMDHLILCYSSLVEVHYVNIADKQFFLKHLFIFEDKEKIVESALEDNKTTPVAHLMNHPSVKFSPNYVVVGKIFIGYFTKKDLKMHVWNIETGTKIKEEICPTNLLRPVRCLDIVCSETSGNVAVIITFGDKKSKLLEQQLLMYSVEQFRFLTFTLTLEKCVNFCVIHKHYLAIQDKYTVRVYNYLNSKLLLSEHVGFSDKLCVLNNKIVFSVYRCIKTFDPSSKALKSCRNIQRMHSFISLSHTFRKHVNLPSFCDRFVQIEKGKLWEVVKVDKKITWLLPFIGYLKSNKVSSRVLLYFEDKLTVLYFW